MSIFHSSVVKKKIEAAFAGREPLDDWHWILSFVLATLVLSPCFIAQGLRLRPDYLAGSGEQVVTEDKVYERSAVDKRAVIHNLRDVMPSFSGECRHKGYIRAKFVLRKTGEVSDISFVKKEGCGKVEEKVVAALHSLRFTPAEKGGVPVSQYMILDFEHVAP